MEIYLECAFEEILDALAAGILLTDDNATVLYLNATAKQHIEVRDAVCIVDHHLRAVDLAARSAFSKALNQHPDDKAESVAQTRTIALPGSETKGLLATIMPLNGRRDPGLRLKATAAIILEAPLDEVHLPYAAFADLYDLTRGEVRLLRSMARRYDVHEAARELGIGVSTAKTHLSHIYSKTATSKLSALLPLLKHSVLRHELIDAFSDGEAAH